jgi:pimeloyl-ACP methyl ester carboxylesterase
MKWFVSLAMAAAVLLGAPRIAHAQDAVGDWGGVLAGQLHIIVRIHRDAAGHLSGGLESPDQGKFVLPLERLEAEGGHLKFAIDQISGAYDGVWDPEKKAWEGTWTQGSKLPLELKSLAAGPIAGPRRPQEEAIAKGGPYQETEVAFDNPDAHITLKGTLCTPMSAKFLPAVVLVAGSGPNKRDEEVFGHKVFAVLSDALCRRGIIVLRYDKRGTGESGGSYEKARLTEFASDAKAAFDFLKTARLVDPSQVGFIGHSEGGLTAPMAAVERPDAAFVVMMAGPGVPGDKLLILQLRAIGHASGMAEAVLAKGEQANGRLFAAILAAPDQDAAQTAALAAIDRGEANKIITPEQARIARLQMSPAMVSLIRYDPAPVLRALKTPLLAVNGSLDTQVPADEDLAAIAAATAGHPDVTLRKLDGLNHLFQTAKTGAPSEYLQIDETMSPAALAVIGDWIAARTKPVMKVGAGRP